MPKRELSCQVEAYSLTKNVLDKRKEINDGLNFKFTYNYSLSVFSKAMQFGDVTFVYMPYP